MTTAQDLERIWELHTSNEFVTLDVDATMATMTDSPEVLHVPTAMGARGRPAVRDFYARWFVGHNPQDFTITSLSRTTGRDRIVDEMLISFTHDSQVPWILPGVAPTGRPVSIAVIAIVTFEGSLISSEHIYWDQASVLSQTQLIEPAALSRLPVVTDQRATLTDGPLNQLVDRGNRLP
ncbi:nuclear transport factor 2 family protein [Streptomyces sp. NPDC007856]|jgi:carboxymethylenebutenolidase|uniref:nuclear transport factor 2 family protein n=1 Tax=unclassified Streptomyces TaxID=2593676 RepID=UPI0036AA56AD